ncbi:MAG: chemotaxis protein CheX [Desulfobacterales bacterium]|nr:chemotaxis protein CheX [Desulfobacterales bacterium]
MKEINSLNLKELVINAVNNVFDMMLDMQVEISDADSQEIVHGNKIVGSVSFAGDLMGSVSIHVSDTFARIMAAAMLGMEVEEIEGEEVNDVIGELSNMIGGDLKSRFCDLGFPCQLSIPSVTSGSDFKIESRDWMQRECFTFCHQQHTALVDIFIKSGG